jgi:hypothetical protein
MRQVDNKQAVCYLPASCNPPLTLWMVTALPWLHDRPLLHYMNYIPEHLLQVWMPVCLTHTYVQG